ncbi:SpaA isopeptide-forming pilin-related protein [Paenibacillus larvae]|uniref:SpaA isopeptide-forming pilin-related protein n=1 Tax=Paenibacillus larvae TaxID=1464 RepID=UPI0004270224|nr:SpaA isopeptide-forming pilin-related protein [Paenibacillus larvae]
MKGSIKEFQPILYKMADSKLQSIVRSSVADSKETVQFTAHFEAREGYIEVSKKGNKAESLSGTVFEVKDGDVTVDTITTGDDGKATTKGLLPNKTYAVGEVKGTTWLYH